jgi:hypothetical protein
MIGTTPLNTTDYIEGAGSATTLVPKAEWSVWFRVGQRPLGVKNITADNVNVYPVPASDKLVIDMLANTAYSTIQIIDMTGRVVMTQPVTTKKQQMNINSLQSGVYIIRLTDDLGSQTYTSRIVKN